MPRDQRVGDDGAEELVLDPARRLRRAQRRDADDQRQPCRRCRARRAAPHSGAPRRHPCRTGSARIARRRRSWPARLFGSQPGGGSIGLSAPPRKKSARPPTLRPVGSSPVSRRRRAVSSSWRGSRSNTGLASGWSPADGSSPRSISRLRTPQRGGADQIALQRDAVAVAAGELQDRLDAGLDQHRRGGDRAEMRARAGAVGDVDGVGQALERQRLGEQIAARRRRPAASLPR